MKKIFAIAAMAAMLIACGDNGEQTNPGTNPNPGTTPGGEQEFQSAITIDGNYADWDAVTENIQVATLPEGEVQYSQLKVFKLYADEMFIHVYCEFDPTNTLVFVPYFDLDSDATTGNTSKWDGAGYEAKAEGAVWSTDEAETTLLEPKAWDPAFYLYTDAGTEEICAAGIGAVVSSVPAPTKDGLYAFEASIVRDLIAMYDLGDTFTCGMIQYDLSWSYIGKLPCKNSADREAGQLEEMLTVTLP